MLTIMKTNRQELFLVLLLAPLSIGFDVDMSLVLGEVRLG
jgi:hypothetical protein